MKQDEHGRVQMGVKNPTCDDGRTNLTIDWDIPTGKGIKNQERIWVIELIDIMPCSSQTEIDTFEMIQKSCSCMIRFLVAWRVTLLVIFGVLSPKFWEAVETYKCYFVIL